MSRRVLVTGGLQGIGKAIALAFKDAGYNVVVNYFKEENHAVAFEKQFALKTFKWDVSDFQACQRGIAEVEKHFGGGIEVLVNNSGIVRDAMLHKQSYENWLAVIQTNLTSVFNMSRSVIEKMREAGFGRIISMSSVNAYGAVGQTNYAASKAGIQGFTQSLALESARCGVTVNAIAPGYVDTSMMNSIPADVLAKIVEKVPMQRLAKVEEIAHTALFLAHELSGFITGAIIPVNGALRLY